VTPALAHFGGSLFLSELKLTDQLRITERLFQGVEVLALKILDQSQLQNRAIIRLAHDDWHISQTGQSSRPPAAFPGNQLELAAARPDDQRLNDALFPDRIGQLRSASSAKSFRGCSGQGRMRWSAMRCTMLRLSKPAGIEGAGAGIDA
jgi:hypothetical protein